MPEQHNWPESHSEQTDVLPVVPSAPSRSNGSNEPTAFGQPPSFDDPTVQWGTKEPEPADRKRKSWRTTGIATGAVFGVLAVLYAVDLLMSQGNVPRGVTVAGVDVGGMSKAEAEQTLRQQIEPRLTKPVQLRAGDLNEPLDPVKAGLALDWAGTLDRAGDQPINPITRLTSFFGSNEVGFTTKIDHAALTAGMEGVRQKVDRAPVEGTIKFDGVTPALVEPKQGQKLDTISAMRLVVNDWATGNVIELPLATTPVKTSPEAVRTALDQIVKPAVSGPVVIKGEGKDATLTPEAIARSLVFEPVDGGQLNVKVDQAKVVEAAGPQLKSTEKEGKDAAIVFEGGKPAVHPSEDGKTINWEPSLAPMVEVLKKPSGREIKAQYTTKPAKVTTEQANQLGIKEVVGEFTTGGFVAESGTNIKVVAQKVTGAIVKPGETFSLNGFTGPRGKPQGYVEAGVIKDGAPGREVGGGISQFATTLYNASYYAALKDAGHKEHSYWISRYPPAREATVFQNHDGSSVIDLKFTNDAPTGIAIQTIWTPSNITVRIWGTKRYTVDSVEGPRTNPTEPQPHPGPAVNCHASNGSPGFTASDTRVLKDVATGKEVRRETRTVKYNPQPKIVCPPPA